MASVTARLTPAVAWLKHNARHEIAAAITVGVTIGEAVLIALPGGPLNDTIKLILPIVGGWAIRGNVVPLSKILGDIPALLPLLTRIEKLLASPPAARSKARSK